MSTPAPFGPIGDLLSRSLNIRHVYGEPVQQGDRIVIPVATVAYGFGAGGGRGPRKERPAGQEGASSGDDRHEAEGAGGGGGVRMAPVGALEITPQGTRFIRLHPLAPWLGAAALGLVVGWVLARRR